ncbi:TIGR01777 family oxidoreductase [Schlesneria paludicola]|uniref:TIGR01777 family oxidoreductase n=1 Tax=Schlesneria paludicola TaxID=360056 RepID=UPI00029A8D22|nr:TIGR01777 family oxidoreductase [Schlesneria paludicola]
MKILVTGATGLVGSELVPFLTRQGNDVYRLTHSKPKEANDIVWDPAHNQLPKARIEGTEAIVHLAGENIAGKRWNPKVKEELRRSRLDGTKLLCETIASMQAPPKTLICASAIGYYGNRGSELLNETSAPGTGFLADLCKDWEAACEPARVKGIRVVNIRIGVILTPKGGALAKMLPPFKMGVGGIMGSGNQYWSWISIDDVVGVIQHCLANEKISGPVNTTAPCPVTNYEFTKALGAVVGRPTFIPMPAFAARLALGEMADNLLLASARVMPNRLSETGYPFRHPALEPALQYLLHTNTGH